MKKRELIKFAISGVCAQIGAEEARVAKVGKDKPNRLEELRAQYTELVALGFNRKDLEEDF